MEYAVRIILIIFAVVGITFFIKSKDRYRFIISDTFWVIVPWTLCLFMYYFSGIDYPIKLEWYMLLYIVLFWLCYFLGKNIVQKILTKKYGENKKRNTITIKKEQPKFNFLPLFFVSLVAVIIYVVYFLAINNIVLGQTRNFNANAFTTFLLIISSSSLIIWLYELSYALLYDKKISWYAFISAIIFNVPGLITSGRDALIIFIIATFITLIYCGNLSVKVLKKKGHTYSKTKKVLCLAMGVVLFYLIFLTSNRYGHSAIKQFMWASGCSFPPYLEFIYYNLGGLGKLILNTVFYYSSQFSKLALVFDHYSGPYLGGLYQLHYVSRLLPESWGLNYTLVNEGVIRAVEEVSIVGMKPLWDTMIGYFIFDFGKILAPVMSFFLGVVVGFAKYLIKLNKSIFNIIVYVLIALGAFISVQFSPFFDYYYIFPFAVLVAIMIYIKYEERKKQVKKQR